MKYVNRAKDSFECNICIIHDESGDFDKEVLLHLSDISTIDIPAYVSGTRKTVRFTGKFDYCVDNERVREIYRWNASKVCRNILEKRVADIVKSYAYEKDVFLPREFVSIITCGKRDEGISPQDYEAKDVKEPEIYENASYNVPYDSVDRRAFTFDDTDGILNDLREHSKILDEICDINQIWQYAAGISKMNDKKLFFIPELHKDVMGRKGSERRLDRCRKAIIEYGVDSMVDAYYAGVPLEDILA